MAQAVMDTSAETLPGNASRDNSPAVSRNREIRKIRNELKKRCHPKKGQKKPQTCGICSKKGHNRKTCPQNLSLVRKKKELNQKKSPKKRYKPSEEEEETQDATWTPSEEHIVEARTEEQENERLYLKRLSKKRKQRRARFLGGRKSKKQPKNEKEKKEEDNVPEELRSLADIPEAEVPNNSSLFPPPVEARHPCDDVVFPSLVDICPVSVIPHHIYTREDLKQCLRIRLCNVLLPVEILGHVISPQKDYDKTSFHVRMQNVRTGEFTVNESFSERIFQDQAEKLGRQFSNIDNFAQAMVDVTWRPLKLAYLTKVNMDENYIFTNEDDRMVRDSTVESIIANTLCQTNMFKTIMEQLVSVTERLNAVEQMFIAGDGSVMKNTDNIRQDIQRVGQAAQSFVSPSTCGSALFQDDDDSEEEDVEEEKLEWSPENAKKMRYGGKSPKTSRPEAGGKSLSMYPRPL